MEQERRITFLINTLYFLTVSACVFLLCKFFLKCLIPFAAGGVIALLVQRPALFISSKTKIKRSVLAGGLALTVFIGTAALILFSGIKAAGAAAGLLDEISGFGGRLSVLLAEIKGAAESFLSLLPEELSSLALQMYDGLFKNIAVSVTSFISSAAGSAAKNAPSFLLSCVVCAAAACYTAADFPKLKKFIRGICGERIYGNILKVKNILANSVFKLLKGYLIIMALTFAELLTGFIIIGIKYAPLLAAVIAVVDILPVLGTGTVLIPWVLCELLLGNTVRGIELAVLYLIITVVRNFAEPKIIGGQIGINPIFTLLAMFVGIKLLGIAGIFILPVALIAVIEYYKNGTSEEQN